MSGYTTYMGKYIDPLAPREDGIDIRDIAHALSLLCRANGHFPSFYSVAQHSIFCMKEAEARGYSPRVQLMCLLHDASEAYISDIIRPVKRILSGYSEIENNLLSAIFEKYLSPIPSEEELIQVSAIDDALLYHEFVWYMGAKLWDEEPPLSSKPEFVFEDFAKVENTFLREFDRLQLLISENKA